MIGQKYSEIAEKTILEINMMLQHLNGVPFKLQVIRDRCEIVHTAEPFTDSPLKVAINNLEVNRAALIKLHHDLIAAVAILTPIEARLLTKEQQAEIDSDDDIPF